MPKASTRTRRVDQTQVCLDGFLSPGISKRASRELGTFGNSHSRGSSFSQCPVCGTEVATRLMNDHLDSVKCLSNEHQKLTEVSNANGKSSELISDEIPQKVINEKKSPDAFALMRAAASAPSTSAHDDTPSGTLPGLFLIHDFITPTEEAALIQFLDDPIRSGAAWKKSNFNGTHMGKKWGVECDLKYRVVTPGKRAMPDELLVLAERMRNLPYEHLVGSFTPNEANAIDYRRAQGMELKPHCDDRQLSSGTLINLSLAGDCVMTYTKDVNSAKSNAQSVAVFLPRRSLQIQSGSVRYNYRHGIKNGNLLHDRRVSVTFRESANPSTETKVRGT